MVSTYEYLARLLTDLGKRKRHPLSVGRKRPGCRAVPVAAALEILENRSLLSAVAAVSHTSAVSTLRVDHLASTPTASTGYTPSQIQTAYGFDQISIGSALNGTGQTIAIVNAYHSPTITNDLRVFDAAFGLPDPPSFKIVSQTGSTTNLPKTDPNATLTSSWELETALDVEWAHALAPGANIILVEANSSSYSDLMTAVRTAANLPGVSVVSMSWGGGEFTTETNYDSFFSTPIGHQGVTFVGSSGDSGAPGGFPSFSPNVLAVGGTSLSLSPTGAYLDESAWKYSGGGISQFESQPSYQQGIVTQTTTRRGIPDVSFVADPQTGVSVYCSYKVGASKAWSQIGGTSLSAPAWASIISIVDQARAANGIGTLDGATQTLPLLYQLSQTNPSAFHDITSGNNSYAATVGYDLVTGLGSPVVNQIVAGLDGSITPTTPRLIFDQISTTGIAGQLFGTVIVSIQDQDGQIFSNDNSLVTLTVMDGPGKFASTSKISVNAVNGIATFNNLVLNTSGTYIITASDIGHSSGVSNAITVSPATASKLVYLQAPTIGSLGVELSPITVAVQDRFGNLVTTDQTAVTITVSSGPSAFSATSILKADVSDGIATFDSLILNTAGTYTVRVTDGSLVSATSISFSVGSTLTAPQDVTLTALTSRTARLTWSSVPDATGYRIYQYVGSQGNYLGTVSATTKTLLLNSLIPGSTVSIMVQAYNRTSVASSVIVSAVLPERNTPKLVLSLSFDNSCNPILSWNSINGADGYRIYSSDGTNRTLLTTVDSRTTNLQLTDTVTGKVYRLQVEFYRGTTVLGSNWITFTQPARSDKIVTTQLKTLLSTVRPLISAH